MGCLGEMGTGILALVLNVSESNTLNMSPQGQCGKGDERCKDRQDCEMLLSGADSSEGTNSTGSSVKRGMLRSLP